MLEEDEASPAVRVSGVSPGAIKLCFSGLTRSFLEDRDDLMRDFIVIARSNTVQIEVTVRTWGGDGLDVFLAELAEEFRGWNGYSDLVFFGTRPDSLGEARGVPCPTDVGSARSTPRARLAVVSAVPPICPYRHPSGDPLDPVIPSKYGTFAEPTRPDCSRRVTGAGVC